MTFERVRSTLILFVLSLAKDWLVASVADPKTESNPKHVLVVRDNRE